VQLRFADKYRACPVCDSSSDLVPSFELALHGRTIHWDHCGRCGLTFQNPRLDVETIKSIYASDAYWGHEKGAEIVYSRYEQQDYIRIRQSHRRLARIKRATGIAGGKLLDVGCATGFFSHVAQQHGFAPTGVDPSGPMVSFGRQRYGLDIRQQTLEEFDGERGAFDLVTLWGTDSHFLHPREGFAKLTAFLRPGGALAMNYQDFSHWIRIAFPGIKRSWNALSLLSTRTLRFLFDQLGLDVVYHRTEWQWAPLSHVFRVAKLPVPSFLQRVVCCVPAVSFPLVIARKR
jgi:2-polyprenyl-3-methyl-5-hydroxy-6-metoxy-1,4-benzoquinol methylase